MRKECGGQKQEGAQEPGGAWLARRGSGVPPREVKQLSSSHTAPERPARIRTPDRPAAMSLPLPPILSFRICKMGAAAGTVGAILRVRGGKGAGGPGVRLGAVMGDLMPVWAMSPLRQPSGKLEVGGPPLSPIPHEDDPWGGYSHSAPTCAT